MKQYLHWDEKTISDFSDENIENLYNQGYVFTRLEKGLIQQTRSVRIDLSKFEMSSENRRILRKTENIDLNVRSLPLSDYHWNIGKLAKDFYNTKFGEGTFSANKIKELLTDDRKSNFNTLFDFSSLGYCICYQTNNIIHYSYPFYDLEASAKDMGMGMMTRAVLYAKEQGKKYLYLGSAQRPNDTYKFQFDGIEWFDGESWKTDFEELKNILQNV